MPRKREKRTGFRTWKFNIPKSTASFLPSLPLSRKGLPLEQTDPPCSRRKCKLGRHLKEFLDPGRNPLFHSQPISPAVFPPVLPKLRLRISEKNYPLAWKRHFLHAMQCNLQQTLARLLCSRKPVAAPALPEEEEGKNPFQYSLGFSRCEMAYYTSPLRHSFKINEYDDIGKKFQSIRNVLPRGI